MTTTTASPLGPHDSIDLDAVRRAEDRDPARKVSNLILLMMFKYGIAKVALVRATDGTRVEVAGGAPPEVGATEVPFEDLRCRLSRMTGIAEPWWVRALWRSRLPWRWVERVEQRWWRPRRDSGAIDFNINNLPVDVRFRAAGEDRIEIGMAVRAERQGVTS